MIRRLDPGRSDGVRSDGEAADDIRRPDRPEGESDGRHGRRRPTHGSHGTPRVSRRAPALLADTAARAHPFLKAAHRGAVTPSRAAAEATPPTGTRRASTSRAALVSLAAEGILDETTRERCRCRRSRRRVTSRSRRRDSSCTAPRARARCSSSFPRSSRARSSFGCSCGSAWRARCRCGGRARASSSRCSPSATAPRAAAPGRPRRPRCAAGAC